MGNNQNEPKKLSAIKLREEMLEDQMKVVNESIRKFGISQEKAKEIAQINVHQAVDMLNRGELTSEALLTALAYRSSIIGKDLNIFTATNFTKALASAIICDNIRKETGKRNWVFEDGAYDSEKFLPPLYGIPISIKDVFHVDEMTTTLGLISKSENYEPEEGLMKCIKNSGMIPFIKTNIPQAGFSVETNNNLWGRTVNPWNRDRACGGSSGGEGAIISSQCSLIGLGSDIGGSIRVPAEFCGIFGLKPYSRRISAKYHANFSRASYSFGQTIPLCIGPLAKSTRDLAMFMDIATNKSFYEGSEDPYVPIVPFNKDAYLEAESGKKKYRIGYLKCLEDFEPSIASTRALNETIKLLEEQGHELVEIKIPNEKEVIRNFVAEFSANRGQNIRELIKGENPIPEYKSSLKIQELWGATYWLVSIFAKMLMPRGYSYGFERKRFSSIIEYQRHMGEVGELKTEWISYWKKNRLDLVISPGFGCQAFPHTKSDLLSFAVAYTFIWNILDMPAGSIPITLVQENEQHFESRYNDLITKEFKSVAENSKGLPVGIQVVGLPYEEEKILGVMACIEKQVKFYNKFPLPNL